jgi:hypothetical protein
LKAGFVVIADGNVFVCGGKCKRFNLIDFLWAVFYTGLRLQNAVRLEAAGSLCCIQAFSGFAATVFPEDTNRVRNDEKRLLFFPARRNGTEPAEALARFRHGL